MHESEMALARSHAALVFVFTNVAILSQIVAAQPDEIGSPLAGSRPNIILIIADDVSATDIGCYGNYDVRKSNLDRLAIEGQLWSRAYLISPVCSSTRCSIIAGRYPHNTGAPQLHAPLPAGQPLFPPLLALPALPGIARHS